MALTAGGTATRRRDRRRAADAPRVGGWTRVGGRRLMATCGQPASAAGALRRAWPVPGRAGPGGRAAGHRHRLRQPHRSADRVRSPGRPRRRNPASTARRSAGTVPRRRVRPRAAAASWTAASSSAPTPCAPTSRSAGAGSRLRRRPGGGRPDRLRPAASLPDLRRRAAAATAADAVRRWRTIRGSSGCAPEAVLNQRLATARWARPGRSRRSRHAGPQPDDSRCLVSTAGRTGKPLALKSLSLPDSEGQRVQSRLASMPVQQPGSSRSKA